MLSPSPDRQPISPANRASGQRGHTPVPFGHSPGNGAFPRNEGRGHKNLVPVRAREGTEQRLSLAGPPSRRSLPRRPRPQAPLPKTAEEKDPEGECNELRQSTEMR